MRQIRTLFDSILGVSLGESSLSPRTKRLLDGGRTKIAKKVAEEATEVALEAVAGRRAGVVGESADLLYNLVVLWVDSGVRPEDVWAEMDRRSESLGIAEKLPKPGRPKPAPAAAKPGTAKHAAPAARPGKKRPKKPSGKVKVRAGKRNGVSLAMGALASLQP
jgi:phosphoribosyl-ATP pyrophosphohydrolase